MEESILNSTKRILGLPDDYTAFDVDIVTHINSAFVILNDMGVGPAEVFSIEDSSAEWAEFSTTTALNLVRSYIFLKVRLLFDPPTTGFTLTAMQEQIKELEWRLNSTREWNLNPTDPLLSVVVEEE